MVVYWFWVGILLKGSTALDSRMGTYLWDLCLDKYTGDVRFHGESFLGEVVDFFLLGGRGRGRGSARARTAESFFAGRRALSNSPIFYVIYYILSSGGFAAACSR